MSHQCTTCACPPQTTPFDQSLDELDFERGIWQAAYYGDTEKISTFLKKGTDINIKDSSGYTALHYAARNYHIEAVKQLVRAGACVNALTKCGLDTPLHRAAYVGHLEVVKYLVANGSNVLLVNDDGQTVLHKAVIGGKVEVVEFLLQCEGLKGIFDKKGKSAKEYAKSEDLLKLF